MEAKHSLDQIRIQIDRIDTELLRLLNERADLVHEIGTIKKNAGLPLPMCKKRPSWRPGK